MPVGRPRTVRGLCSRLPFVSVEREFSLSSTGVQELPLASRLAVLEGVRREVECMEDLPSWLAQSRNEDGSQTVGEQGGG